MEIVVAKPPIWDEVVKRFEITEGTIFCWGFSIYNPNDRVIDDHLIAHERVHARQQELAGGPEPWWDRYLDDAEFRLKQEIPAYRAQYDSFRKTTADRNARARYLDHLARSLSGGIYGHLVPYRKARTLIYV